MSLKFLIVCAVLIAGALAAVDCKPIVEQSDGTTTKNYQYDLSPLCHEDGVSDTLFSNVGSGASILYMNICGLSSAKCRSGTSVCLRDDTWTYHAIGMLASQSFDAPIDIDPGQGIRVTYGDGDECITGTYQGVVTLNCDASEEGVITDIEPGDCWFKVSIATKYACGKEVDSNSENGGGKDSGEVAAIVILVILLVGFAGYFAFGVFYQKKFNDASSPREYIIHNEFWCALPGLVKDGVLFIAHGCKKGDYVSV